MQFLLSVGASIIFSISACGSSDLKNLAISARRSLIKTFETFERWPIVWLLQTKKTERALLLKKRRSSTEG